MCLGMCVCYWKLQRLDYFSNMHQICRIPVTSDSLQGESSLFTSSFIFSIYVSVAIFWSKLHDSYKIGSKL